jgi:hypothetical protein
MIGARKEASTMKRMVILKKIIPKLKNLLKELRRSMQVQRSTEK